MQQSAIWSGKSGNAYVTVRYDLGAPAPALPAGHFAAGAAGGLARVRILTEFGANPSIFVRSRGAARRRGVADWAPRWLAGPVRKRRHMGLVDCS